MTKRITGSVAQFGSKGYGFIDGDDGVRYFVHQKSIKDVTRPKPNTRISFTPDHSERGAVAFDAKLAKESFSEPLTDAKIRTMFWFLLSLQIATIAFLIYIFSK